MNRSETLNAARACVCGGRDLDYGTPEDNFGTIAEFWTAYFGFEIKAKDVALALALVKVARAKSSINADNYIDLAGYAACAGELAAMENNNPDMAAPESVKSFAARTALEGVIDRGVDN